MSVYSDYIVGLSPVSYWRLGESSGTTMADVQAANAGTYRNTPTLGVVGGIVGDTDTAISLVAATNNYADVADHASLKPTTALSLVGWVNTSTTATYTYVCRKYQSAGYAIRTNVTTGRVEFFLNVGGFKNAVSTTAASLADGKWHCLAGTWDGTTMRVYADGVEQKNTAASGTLSHDTSVLHIGAYAIGSEWCTGSVDEVAVFNTTLTPTQVVDIHRLGVGNWPPANPAMPQRQVFNPNLRR